MVLGIAAPVQAVPCTRALEWLQLTSYPTPILGAGAAISGGWVIVVGGGTAPNQYTGAVRRAPILNQETGELGPWEDLTEFPGGARIHPQVFIVGARLYAMGGYTPGGAMSDCYSAEITEAGLGPWQTECSLVLPHNNAHDGFVRDGYLYLISSGETWGDHFPRAQRAQIQPDGSLGCWQIVSEPIPIAWQDYEIAATDSHVLVFGGYDFEQDATTGRIYRGTIDESGQVVDWQDAGELPIGLQNAASCFYPIGGGVYEGYLFGGWNWELDSCPALAAVWIVRIEVDGSLSKWWPVGCLPQPLMSHTRASYNSLLFLIGGSQGPHGGATPIADVYALDPGITAVPPEIPIPGRPAELISIPNPFNPSTTLRFELPKDARVTLSIYGVDGRLVSRLLDGQMPTGSHSIMWEGRDQQGRRMPSGVYLARLTQDGAASIEKLIMLK